MNPLPLSARKIVWVKSNGERRCQPQKSWITGKGLRQAPKGKGRLSQVLANTLFGSLFATSISVVLFGGGWFFSVEYAKKRQLMEHARFFFSMSSLFKMYRREIFEQAAIVLQSEVNSLSYVKAVGRASHSPKAK